ncbi:MAG TPA: DUF1499 domain-containing protein [Beijerinckiaceae bacterium]|jgi:uncharacterized protein (DUF1499 family)
MRRLILEEPVSRAAIWSPRVAAFAIAVTVIAVILVRFGRIELLPGAVSIATGLVLAGVAVLLALAAFARVWTEGRRGLGSAVYGLVLAAFVLGYPGFYALRGLTLPRLTDVTTDIDQPPTFSRSQAAFEARGGRVPADPPAETRQRQRDAYPFVAPLTLDLPPQEAYEIVRQAALNRGWSIVEASRPGGRLGLGRLDAVDRSFLLRLPDDVTVRLRPRADGTRIDVRSASRYGGHDYGANARRIRNFLDEVSNLAITQK